MDGQGDWAMLGEGVCDVATVIEEICRAPRFNGCIVAEEESPAAASEPAGAVRANRGTIRHLGFD